ncbi:MAG: histidinol dehydrogenase, partial [Lysobacter sp.]|nr:histidinol dehydrogenase [Lysobacter sp.]
MSGPMDLSDTDSGDRFVAAAPPVVPLEWRELDEAARARVLRRPAQVVGAEVGAAVATIIAQVRGGGDAALRELSLRLDKVCLQDFRVSDEEIAAAQAGV